MKGKGNMDSSEVSYNKRKKTLLQKMEEITTLCGVQASLVIYSDLEEGGRAAIWPANARQVEGVVNKLKNGIAMGMPGTKVSDVDSLVEARLDKEKLKLAKLRWMSEDKETRMLMSDCLAGKDLSGLSVVELNELNRLIGENLKTMSHLIVEEARAGLNGGQEQAGPSGK